MSRNAEGLWIITDIYSGGARGKVRTAVTKKGRDRAIRAALRHASHVEVEHYNVQHVNSYLENKKSNP